MFLSFGHCGGATEDVWLTQENGGSEAAIQSAMQRAQQRILMADEEFIAATAPRPAGVGRQTARARRVPVYDSDVSHLDGNHCCAGLPYVMSRIFADPL